MVIKTLLYRGALKSCNYHCSYCPFSKHRISEKELLKDQKQLERFCESMKQRSQTFDIESLMIVPYGEALIHPYYWKGMAQISQLDSIHAVGSQTNFSFPISKSLQIFENAGGKREKLRIWATFHPQMISLSLFLEQCLKLKEEDISFCVGVVGVPENLELVKQLRRDLPKDVYLWINRMDGLKRPYSEKEREVFQSIDPFFQQQLVRIKADKTQCANRLFVEGNGKLHLCNISNVLNDNWYDLQDHLPQLECSKRVCSCYLAYAGREDYKFSSSFGHYPLFRIPWRPKAIFIDIDGTMYGNGKIDSTVITWLEKQKEFALLFLATSRPYKEALKRCRQVIHLFDGGVFASGAHICLNTNGTREKKETFLALEDSIISILKKKEAEYRFRIHVYKSDVLYKITLEKPRRHRWRENEIHSLKQLLSTDSIRWFHEENCLQLVSHHADKGTGMRKLCQWLEITTRDCVAVGNSAEDLSMFQLCGYAIAPIDSTLEVQNAVAQIGFDTCEPWNDKTFI